MNTVSMTITVELITIIGAAIAVAIGIVLWVFREFMKRDKDITELRLHVAENYATKEGVSESFQQVMRSIEALSDRINRYFERDFHDKS